MEPHNEQVTPENVEQKIQQVFASHGQQPGNHISPETRIIQELYTMHNGEEGIMTRVWEQLQERYPEIDDNVTEFVTQPLKSIKSVPEVNQAPLTQRPIPFKSAKKGWLQRTSILIAAMLSLLLISGTFFFFNWFRSASPIATPSVTLSRGPLQFYDLHGGLIYQIDSQHTIDRNKNRSTADFIDYTLDELAQDLHVPRADLLDRGLKITTTLDLNLQNTTQQIAIQQIAKEKEHNINDAAVVILDYHDGSIRSLFGSINTQNNGSFNVATQNPRMLGSAFMPIVYATAFEQGISPGEVVNDKATTFPNPGGGPAYAPQNYDHRFHGLMPYRNALQNSFNIPAIQLLTRTKIEPTNKESVTLGLKVPNPDQQGLSMALGTFEETVLDATAAYGTMANQGVRIPPHAITSITDANGHVIHTKNLSTQAMSPATAFMITDVLSDNQARSYEYSLCSPMLLFTTTPEQCQAGNTGTLRPVAAKTGFDGSFRDSWTIGYTSDYVVGAWSGNADYSPANQILPSQNGAPQIWHDTMLLAEQGLPIKAFPAPPANVVKQTKTDQGLTTTDWYLTGK